MKKLCSVFVAADFLPLGFCEPFKIQLKTPLFFKPCKSFVLPSTVWNIFKCMEFIAFYGFDACIDHTLFTSLGNGFPRYSPSHKTLFIFVKSSLCCSKPSSAPFLSVPTIGTVHGRPAHRLHCAA